MANIIIYRLIFKFVGAPKAEGIFTFSSLEELIMKQDPKSENINIGCKDNCTISAACPSLPSSFPSSRVTAVKEHSLTTCYSRGPVTDCCHQCVTSLG